jgi:two-component system sensor histidine kinase QseC
MVQGRSWRVFSTWDTRRRYLVQVAERDEARREIATGVAASLLLPLLFVLPLLGFLIWLAIARGLRPLTALGRQVEAREAGNLTALDPGDAPLEIVPLVRSLNALFARVASLIENERRFTADAAHELRTPLAALRAQAQVALGAGDDAERRRALANVIAGCDRATRLAEQMLTLARLEPEQRGGHAGRCELRALARQAAADLAPAALAKGIELEMIAGRDVEVHAQPALIAILLRNLVDNAIRYSASEGHVQIAVSESGSTKCIAVSDDGPGIEAGERQKVGQRFYRVLGSGESGSGLGLSIVHRIAAIHGATVTLGEGLGGRGLRVTVEFRR